MKHEFDKLLQNNNLQNLSCTDNNDERRLRRPEAENPNSFKDNDLGKVTKPLGVSGEYSECPLLTSFDADLQKVIKNWDEIPIHLKQAILTIANSTHL